MTDVPRIKDPLRYRMYFWLMDACLIFAIVGFLDWILSPYTPGDENVPAWYIALAIAVLPFNTLVPCFLMVARFMRDEYAEQLWRRSALVFAYAFATLPVMYYASVLIASYALGQPEQATPFVAWSLSEVEWFTAIYRFWLGFMILFVVIFQFLRWRDSK